VGFAHTGPQVSDAFISSFFEMAVIPMVGNDYEVRPHHHLFVYGVLHRYCGRLQRCPQCLLEQYLRPHGRASL
jgi:hypothetical protein